MRRVAFFAGLLVILGSAAAWLTLPRPAAAGVTLGVYTGTAQVTRSGSATAAAARSGDRLRSGDRVATGPGTRVRLLFRSADQVRIDSGSVVVIGRDDASRTGLELLAGRSWSRVLAGTGSRHEVDAAGHAILGGEIGSEFSVALTAAGGVVVGVFAGTAAAGGITARASEQLLMGPASPALVAAMPDTNRKEAWPVLNLALDLVPVAAGPAAVGTGTLLPGEESTEQQAVSILPSPSPDLVFTAAWGSGSLELVVVGPDGIVATRGSGIPPLTVVVPKAKAGGWQYLVRDLDASGGASVWFVLVSVVTPSKG